MAHTPTQSELQSLAPYTGETFRGAMQRVLASPLLPTIVQAYFPQMSMAQIVAWAEPLRTADEMQKAFISPLIKTLVQRSSSGISLGGIAQLRPDTEYVFLSTHRDIILDPGLFSWTLFMNGRRTCDICLGDNLLTDPWIRDLMKINKGVTVRRSASPRELLQWSTALSEHIRTNIVDKRESIWLAQREGRAKDGDDRTQGGVLKMLVLSGEGTPFARLASLNLTPVAISYEFEPCDILKAREVYLTEKNGTYVKGEREDAESMQRSFGGWKGGMHIEIGAPLGADMLATLDAKASRNEQLRAVGEAIDRQLHRMFRLWPTNYIAADLLDNASRERARYTDDEKARFVERMEKRVRAAAGEDSEAFAGIRRHFLLVYANPVFNARAAV